ncbi:hypothetical protein KTE19_02225 [Lentilactobacillus sp. IMAU92037]|uniref:hypothetical protein n=1 Tax=Lentilactobacillus TaxID=2767893 RepID=UPI001C2613DD|nr:MULTISPECIES: hypothetical protein [Lentilactobacillus]MBU9788170.1 hypothetical protein [Lentilactobacillus dabitei]MBV0929542.1 hypothetical protein [Lentilactobacillus dabitei]MDM7515122.1 hypothetical protein [Lentilactobacillus sp. TOM.63]
MKRANSRRHRAAEKSHRFLVVFLVILLLTIAFFCDYYKGTVRQTPLFYLLTFVEVGCEALAGGYIGWRIVNRFLK